MLNEFFQLLMSPLTFTSRCFQAVALAEDASVEFLKGIRDIRTDKEFSKYIGLVYGKL